MGRNHLPLLLWLLGVGLWSPVVVDNCIGEGCDTTMVREIPKAPDDPDTVISPEVPPAGSVQAVGNVAASGRKGCIDVNRAGEKELDALPGVGPAIARRIIDFRDKNGNFAGLADLDAVKGIGPAMLQKLDGRVCF